eukprot:scaffold12492_cov98-Isochrysis_galbana.AAC.1
MTAVMGTASTMPVMPQTEPHSKMASITITGSRLVEFAKTLGEYEIGVSRQRLGAGWRLRRRVLEACAGADGHGGP